MPNVYLPDNTDTEKNTPWKQGNLILVDNVNTEKTTVTKLGSVNTVDNDDDKLPTVWKPGFECIVPNFSMEGDLDIGAAPLTIQFTVTIIEGSTPLSYLWDFGDGTTSTEQNPEHTFTDVGSYNVTVIVSNACGEASLPWAVDVLAGNCAPTAWSLSAEAVLDNGGSPRTANGIAYGAGRFVVAGQGIRLAYSTDGVTWIPCTHSSIRTFNDIHFAAGLFVAVGENGACWTSTDGITFTDRSSQFNSSTALSSVYYGGGTWVIDGAGNGRMYTSPDGITWTESNGTSFTPFGNFFPSNRLTYGAGVFVAVGNLKIATSATGTSWTTRATIPSGFEPFGVAYNADDNIFIVACWDNRRYISSDGGINWTSLGGSSGRGTSNMECIEYACGVWITGWEDNFIDQSTDNGTSWPVTFDPTTPAPTDLPIYDIAHDTVNDVWLGVGSYGRVFKGIV
jgi:PKD repeat protein